MGKTVTQQEDKTQGEEAVKQGQTISEEEPREDKAKKFPSFRPRYYRPGRGTSYPTTVTTTALVSRFTVATTVVATILPRQSRYYRAACAQNRAYGPCIPSFYSLAYK